MKENIINIIRAVPISGKTYEEYVEAVADRLCSEEYRKASQIFAEIGELINEYLDGRIYTHDFCTNLAELKKKYESEKDNG